MRGGTEQRADDVHQLAQHGISGVTSPLPFLDQIQRAFGSHDLSGIKAHVGGAAAHAAEGMGATAYASGDRVAFRRAPDLHTAAHEAAHVIQQRAGVQLEGGVGETGDVYERHADAVAAAVVAGRSAENLLHGMAGAGGSASSPLQQAVQRKDVSTHFGTFKSTKFEKFGTTGVEAIIEFHPDATKISATKIGLTQSVKITYADGSHTGIDPTKEGRRVKSGPGQDFVLDRISSRNNPIYGAGDLRAREGLEDTASNNNPTADPTRVGGNASYQLGYAYTDAGGLHKKEAALHDRPTGGSNVFETTALGLEGRDEDKYFGSVKWGYQQVGADVNISDIELASMGVPTQNYLAAAQLWNDTKTRGTLEVTADPARAKNAADMTAVDVAKSTRLRQLGEYLLGGKPVVKVETLDSSKQYFVHVVDLKDIQDGNDTVNVPIPVVFVNPAVIGLFSDAEMKHKVKDLPANTRMQNTTCTIHGSYGMRIVDGPDIGLTGYVDQTRIQRERRP